MSTAITSTQHQRYAVKIAPHDNNQHKLISVSGTVPSEPMLGAVSGSSAPTEGPDTAILSPSRREAEIAATLGYGAYAIFAPASGL